MYKDTAFNSAEATDDEVSQPPSKRRRVPAWLTFANVGTVVRAFWLIDKVLKILGLEPHQLSDITTTIQHIVSSLF